MKLNLGCGSILLAGYVNVDKYSEHPDVVKEDAVEYLEGLEEGSVDEIVTFHMIEHLHPSKARDLIRLSFRVLRKGGKLIVECPNFRETVREYLAGNKKRIANVYGHQRYPGDSHCWGYDNETLPALFEKFRFAVVHIGAGTDRHIVWEPCLRVEGVKP